MWFEAGSGRYLRVVLRSFLLAQGSWLSPAPSAGGWTLTREERPTEAIARVAVGSQSLRPERNRARVPNADSSCPLVMRRWTDPAQISAGRPDEREGFPMGFRLRVRRRALVAGAVGGAAIAHHERKKAGEQAYDEAPADDQAPADDGQDQAQYAPPPADPADEIEHLAQLHTSGALTDDEFAAAKAKILGT